MDASCTDGIDTGFVALGFGKVAVLGVVQGISELLPISSTAHMRLVPELLGWRDPGSAFSAAMQLAALAAVVSYFWQDLKALAGGTIEGLRNRDWQNADLRLTLGIGLGTLPLIVAGMLLSPVLNACNSPLRTVPVIAVACFVMGILLVVTELVARHVRTLRSATIRDAVIVGLSQVGALIPGVSRSGSTLTAALLLNFKRTDAASFSFLLGIPAIFLAGVREIWILHKAGLSMDGWAILAVGLVVASISAFAAVWTLMQILERFATWPFAVYRIALGAALLLASSPGLLARWGW